MVSEDKVKFTVFAEDSDLHGVRQVTRRENGLARRIFWGILLALSLTILVYNTSMQIINFLKWEHITKYDVTFVHKLDFPAVTICNVNKHKRSNMTLWDIYEMGPHLEMTDENRTLLHPELYPQDWYNETFVGRDWQQVADDNQGVEYSIKDFYERTAHQFEDMVQHCQWKGVDCSASSWTEDYTHYSKCYTFNADGDHHLYKAGSEAQDEGEKEDVDESVHITKTARAKEKGRGDQSSSSTTQKNMSLTQLLADSSDDEEEDSDDTFTRARKEVDYYRQVSRKLIGATEPIHLWWHFRGKQFPMLQRVARKYLSVNATSVASVRLFSLAGQIATKKRNRLKPGKVDMYTCLAYNLKKNPGNGLQLVLYDEEVDYIESKDSEDLGFKFLAHDPIEPPFLKELGFGLAPGYHYLIALRQREIFGLGKQYTECEVDHTTTYFPNYTIPGCRIECETETIYSKCQCKLVESPGDYPVCSVEGFDCAELTLKEIEESDSCLCKNPCHAVQYPYTMSMLELRSSTIDKLKKKHPIPETLEVHQLAVLNIYFDSLAYEEVIQVPAYTWLDILSDFGGTMGLWLGASVLATAQLLDYLIMYCSAKCCKKGQVEQVSIGPAETTKEETA